MTDRLLFILKRNLGHGHHQTIKSPFQNRPARFADEARVGQKNKITRRWAKRGTRPSAPQDQRTALTYIFGAICPVEGKAQAWCCLGATRRR
jgi:hypothetical protein